jgi:hypothetical protein
MNNSKEQKALTFLNDDEEAWKGLDNFPSEDIERQGDQTTQGANNQGKQLQWTQESNKQLRRNK